MLHKTLHKALTVFIATVWLVNGLYCKVLDYVHRHQEIVERITNFDRPTAAYLTFAIGISEIFMAIWVLSRFQTRLNAILQITLVAIMNILEVIYARDLLLWGEINLLFAFLFIVIVFYNEFYLGKKSIR